MKKLDQTMTDSDDSFIIQKRQVGEPISAAFTIASSKLSSDEPEDEKLRLAASKISEETLRFYDGNDDKVLEQKEMESLLKNYAKKMHEVLIKRAKMKKADPLMSNKEVKEFLDESFDKLEK